MISTLRLASTHASSAGTSSKGIPTSDGWLITTGDDDDPGIPGALSSRYDELNTTVCTIEVPSVTEYARKITEAGGRVVAPQITIPGEGFVQYCEDLEGNGFAIIEYVEETE